jgi:hypothetical protein
LAIYCTKKFLEKTCQASFSGETHVPVCVEIGRATASPDGTSRTNADIDGFAIDFVMVEPVFLIHG